MKHLALLLLASCTLETSLGDSQVPSSQPALGTTRWSLVLGVSNNEMVDPNGLAFASDGDVIAGGTRWLGDALHFHGFLTRRSGIDGSLEWQVVLDGPAPATSQVTAIATSGTSIIAVGHFAGTIDFGGETRSTSTTTPGAIPATVDLFVASYSANGVLEWVRTLDCTAMAVGEAVATSSDTIYVGGWYRGLVDVGGGPVGKATDWEEQSDGLLLAYSLSGDFRWGRVFAGGSNVNDIVVLPDGDPLISGNTASGTSFGGAPMTDRGQALARFSPDGTHQMSSMVSGGPGDVAMGLALVGDGNAILSRHRQSGTTYINERSLVDTDGVPSWTQETVKVEAGHPAAHAPGFVLGGSGYPSADLGTGALGPHGLYVAAYDLTGAAVEVRSYGAPTAGAHQLMGIASAPSGEVAFAVRFSDPIDFDLGPLTPNGDSLAIVLLDAPGSD